MNIVHKAVVLVIIIMLCACAGLLLSPAERAFESGLTLFNAGKYAEAAQYFAKAVEADPKFGKAYLYLGRSYLNLGRFRDAVEPLRAAFSLEPEQSRKEIASLLLNAFLGAGKTSLSKGIIWKQSKCSARPSSLILSSKKAGLILYLH